MCQQPDTEALLAELRSEMRAHQYDYEDEYGYRYHLDQLQSSDVTIDVWNRLTTDERLWVADRITLWEQVADEVADAVSEIWRVQRERREAEQRVAEAAKRAAEEQAERQRREAEEQREREREQARQEKAERLAAERVKRAARLRAMEPDLADDRYAVIARDYPGVRWYAGVDRAEAERLVESVLPSSDDMPTYALRVPLDRVPDLAADLVGADLAVPKGELGFGFTGYTATYFLIDRAEGRVVGVATLDDTEYALRPLLNLAAGRRDPYTQIIKQRLREAADARRERARADNLRQYGLDLSEAEHAEMLARSDPVDDGEVAGGTGWDYLRNRGRYMQARRASGLDDPSKPPKAKKPKAKPDPDQVMREQVIAYMRDHPGQTRTEIRGELKGPNDRKSRVIRELIEDHTLTEEHRRIYLAAV